MDNLCPVCKEEAIAICRCMRMDSYCSNDHHWHTCTIHKTKVIGQSDHALPTMTCTCINKEN